MESAFYSQSQFTIDSHETHGDTMELWVRPIQSHFPCPKCGGVDNQKSGTYIRDCMDVPIGDKKVMLHIHTNRFKCCNPKCDMTIFSPRLGFVEKGQNITTRLRELIKQESSGRTTFVAVAERYGVDEKLVRSLFREYLHDLEETLLYKQAKHIAIDEAHLANVARCVISNTSGTMAEIVDILPDCKKDTVINALKRFDNKQAIETVTIDMSQGYKAAIQEALPWAKIIVDRFHVVMHAIDSMESCRKALNASRGKPIQLDTEGNKLPKLNHFWLKKNNENLAETPRRCLAEILKADDDLAVIYSLKEEFRIIYTSKTRDEAEKRFAAWADRIPADKFYDPYRKLIKTVSTWKEFIFNYFDEPVDQRHTNAQAESINGVIKKVMRNGYGYSFDVLRGKMIHSSRKCQPRRVNSKAAKTGSYAMSLMAFYNRSFITCDSYDDVGYLLQEAKARVPELAEINILSLDTKLHETEGLIEQLSVIADSMDREYGECFDMERPEWAGIPITDLEDELAACVQIAKADYKGESEPST